MSSSSPLLVSSINFAKENVDDLLGKRFVSDNVEVISSGQVISNVS